MKKILIPIAACILSFVSCNVSGQQSPSRIFAIALVSLAKMFTSSGTRYGTYATSVASISTGFASSARALIQ
jgi:hypothetical protein